MQDRKLRRLVPVLVASIAGLVVSVPVVAVAASEPDRAAARAPMCGSYSGRLLEGYWRCTFADEFTGTTVDRSKWLVQVTADNGYHSGEECFVDNGDNVKVADGTLHLTARRAATPFWCATPYGGYQSQYTSGSVSTWGRFAQTYGRFEIRAKFPVAYVAGLHSALWLYPQNLTYGPWPNSGEIDIAEYYTAYPDRAIPYVHYAQSAYDPTVTKTDCLIGDPAAFHSYTAEWTPTSITIAFDGKTCLVHRWNAAPPLTGAAPFDNPFIAVLTQALGVHTNAFDPARTPLPATMQVDYVRAWSWVPQADGPSWAPKDPVANP